jgi:acyl transferase domain-containing protein/acyl carrier protein
MSDREATDQNMDTAIAIISMSGRFPGAVDVEAFWQNLRDGVESITCFSNEELLQAGVDPALLKDVNYVKAGATLEGIDQFDAAFFGLTPKETQIMDPQQRLFLETAWNALESAGYDPETYGGSIGLFAGTALSTYLLHNINANPEVLATVSDMQLVLGNDKDALTTRAAYLLNLTGPCYSVQTFCSTSLVSVCVACSSLLSGECDMALAGGVMIAVPQKAGYYYEEGGVASPDARCRAFDADANGSPLGNGVAVVMLKRFSEALADGDSIHAVIKGWAVNNDGSLKVGYTAPGVTGQASVITEALANAEVSPESIDYIEAHGTGTALGDAVELTALIKAFEEQTAQKTFCALGSAKTNVGHLDRAAGATGLIKTVLALKHAQIPPSLNYKAPNTQVNLADSPFYVNTQLSPWLPSKDHPRRAGVSAFGIGGTNAHVIVEETPEMEPTSSSRPYQLLLFSAKTETALRSMRSNLSAHLAKNPPAELADVAYTLQLGRKHFDHRSAIVSRNSIPEAIVALQATDVRALNQAQNNRPLIFLFSGVGEHYVGMARELYEQETIFRMWVDRCCDLLRQYMNLDLRELLWPIEPSRNGQRPGLDLRAMLGRDQRTELDQRLRRTRYAQPVVFVVEYALAQLLQHWGIMPQALMGYSLGEYVAASLAGVLRLEDALRLVALRAALIDELPAGAMLAVALSEQDVASYLSEEIDLAVSSGPRMSVLAGSLAAIEQLEPQMQALEVVSMRIETTHAFHSRMLEPVGTALRALLGTIALSAPQIPYISNVTGNWITETEATNPDYWVQQMCQTVRFTEGIGQLMQRHQTPILLEIGAGQGLSSQARLHPACQGETQAAIFPTIRVAYDHQADQAFLLETVGRIWMAGGEVDWQRFYSDERRRRIPLPTYPFERQSYWIEPVRSEVSASLASGRKKSDIGSWFYAPTWQVAPLLASEKTLPVSGPVLVLLDEGGKGELVAQGLERQGRQVIRVFPADHYWQRDDKTFELSIDAQEDYLQLLASLHDRQMLPDRIIHCLSITDVDDVSDGVDGFKRMQARGLYSLLALTRALADHAHTDEIELAVVTNGMYAVDGQEVVRPEKATLAGACKVIAQEYPGLRTRCLDLGSGQEAELEMLIAELIGDKFVPEVAYRTGQRWEQQFLIQPMDEPDKSSLRPKGVYLLTGGLGGVGLTLAEELAHQVQAKLVLVGRSSFPARGEWEQWLREHGEDEACSRRIRAVQHLEALGSEVCVVQADVACEQQMSDVMRLVDERFGALHGVIYCAGYTTSDAFKYIQEMHVEKCEQHFQTKVYGLYVLEQILRGRELDFCMIFSSLSSVLGGLGFCAYTAANAFVDAFVYQHNRILPQLWNRVSWDTWLVSSVTSAGVMGGTVAEYAMTPEEGIAAFQRVLASNAYHIVNSTGDLQHRINQWLYFDTTVAQSSSPESITTSSPLLADSSKPRAAVPTNDLEQHIAEIWRRVLGVEEVGVDENFFDLGGNSFIGLQVLSKIRKELQVQVPVVALFEAPTIRTMARYLRPAGQPEQEESRKQLQQRRSQARQRTGEQGIAIVAMTGRFPGAMTVEQFWENLYEGRESITFFEDEELLAAGLDAETIGKENYVKARPILEDVAGFDAALFGYSPREAELMDPQHRLFLECSWEALELAGYDPTTYAGLIGVFGGSNISMYLLRMLQYPEIAKQMNIYQMVIGNDKDSLTTTVSYKLDLKGPSYAVQTFCSTSLVATHLACQSLLNGECDLALAGGVSIRVPVVAGHLYEPGGMESPDGHCRSFDAQAKGGMFGDGVGIVVLKRLEEALADGDSIHAVIKGSAINNDGSLKVSYTAPSVQGQADVVTAALEQAGVSAETIQYIEAHGTATELGDPIEVASLSKAFRTQTQRKQYCALGSVKTNVGHLDRAAGTSGLIKVVMGLKHRCIPASLHYEEPNPAIDFEQSPFYVNARRPASLHYEEPNPAIDFEQSPFYVNARRAEWPANGKEPRRAGINSLGMGGTNVHMVVEEAPEQERSGASRRQQLLLFSGRTREALEGVSTRMQEYLQEHKGEVLGDIAYTLQVGRRSLPVRRVVLCESHEQAIEALQTGDPALVFDYVQTSSERPVAFLFSGVGEQYTGMARELYQQEEIFRHWVDRCCGLLQPLLRVDLREIIFGNAATKARPLFSREPSAVEATQTAPSLDLRAMLKRGERSAALTDPRLGQTCYAQPAVFVIEYALTQVLAQWGIRPAAMIGYSLGEYVAACVAGVLSLEDALTLVARRAALIEALPAGAMLAVPLSEGEVQSYLSSEVNLAVTTGPNACILSGPVAEIAAIEEHLHRQNISYRRLETTHAFHSHMLEPVGEAMRELLQNIRLSAPHVPYISDLTGDWITAEEATDPDYWVLQMFQTVRFAEGIAQLVQKQEMIILEVGPGQSLGSMVKQHPACKGEQQSLVLATLRSAYERRSDQGYLLLMLGKLWLAGARINWAGFYHAERRRRIPLPTYPFEHQRYWIEPLPRLAQAKQAIDPTKLNLNVDEMERIKDIADWFFLPSWKKMLPLQPFNGELRHEALETWLIFADAVGIGQQIAASLASYDQDVVVVRPGNTFIKDSNGNYRLRPSIHEDYEALLKSLGQQKKVPQKIVHCWMVTASGEVPEEAQAALSYVLEHGFYSLMALAQALGSQGIDTASLCTISNELQDTLGSERICPEKATLIGPCKVIPQEYANIHSRSVDIVLPPSGSKEEEMLVEQLVAELTCVSNDIFVALRSGYRWIQNYEPVQLPKVAIRQAGVFRERGVYLVTGGLGGIALAMAEHLAQTVQARLVLVGRTEMPAREEWPALLEAHGETDGMGYKIRRLQHLEEIGAQVLTAVADVTNELQMREVIQCALDRFGAINGVFYAAAVPPSGLIQLKTPEMAASVMAPKVIGPLVLERVLAGLDLDFLVFFSSMSSATGGGPGQVDYCAANAFLDAYARRNYNKHGCTISIDWGEWQWDAWSEGLLGFPEVLQNYFRQVRKKFGISFEDGYEVLSRVLARGVPQIVVSTQDFVSMVEGSKHFSINTLVEAVSETRTVETFYARPTLGTTYVAPTSGIEEEIAAVWSGLLGIEKIGSQDNFFELGGHSLMGTQLMSRLRNIFHINLPLSALFGAPTIADLAIIIELALLDEIEKLEEEEVAKYI